MQIKNQIDDVLHRIRVKLYPNHFTNVQGKYLARTDNEASLDVKQVCGIAISRGGVHNVDLDDFIEYVNQYNAEVAYQLCDGYAVNNGYYSIHPGISGTFNSEKDIHDHKKNPVRFKFRVLSGMRRLIPFINVDIEGIANVGGYIDEFIDFDEHSVNTLYAPGDQFILHGYKIKLAGNDPGVGLFLVPVDNPSAAVKITRTGEITASKITGIMPASTYNKNRIEVRTQYSGASNKLLSTPRIITSPFILEQV